MLHILHYTTLQLDFWEFSRDRFQRRTCKSFTNWLKEKKIGTKQEILAMPETGVNYKTKEWITGTRSQRGCWAEDWSRGCSCQSRTCLMKMLMTAEKIAELIHGRQWNPWVKNYGLGSSLFHIGSGTFYLWGLKYLTYLYFSLLV